METQGFIKGQAPGKLTACSPELTQLLLTTQPTFSMEDLAQVTYPAHVHNPLSQLFKMLMKPLGQDRRVCSLIIGVQEFKCFQPVEVLVGKVR